MNKLLGIALFTFFFLIATISAQATVFNPLTSAELQTALNDAAGNGLDDTINLAANTTYATSGNGNTRFIYTSAEANSLTIAGAGAGSSILDGGGIGGSEVLEINVNAAALIQLTDFTIQNAVDSGAGAAGGVSLITDGNAVVQNCEFLNNTHGNEAGAFIAVQGDLLLDNNIFFGNNSGFEGGGFFTSGGNLTFTNNTFEMNTGGFEGGAFVVADNLTVDNNTFSGNTGDFEGGGFFSSSGDHTFTNNTFHMNTGDFEGGAFVTASNTLLVDGNTFTNNTGDFEGGGFFSGGTDNTFTNNTFTMNTGGFEGGAFVASSASLIVDSNTFSQNTGDFEGGGFFGATATITFINNTLLNNSSTDNFQGGAFVSGTGGVQFINNILAGNSSANGTDPVVGGGAFIGSPAAMDIINNTIFDNRLVDTNAQAFGGGIFVGLSSDSATTNIYNNIILDNTAPAGQGQDLLVDFSGGPNAVINFFNNDYAEACFDDGVTVDCDPVAVLGANQGNNLIGIDPLFVDAPGGNFQLGIGSPVIDKGDLAAPSLPATDHDGNPRVVGGGVDMGALEAQADIAVDPASLNFGTVGTGQSVPLILTILNEGAVPLQVNGMDLSDDVNFSLDVNGGPNPCGSVSFTLNVGESCTVEVTFTPATDGTFDGTLTINSDDPDESPLVVILTGIGQVIDLSGGGCVLNGGTSGLPPTGWLLAWLPVAVMGWCLRKKYRA